MPFQLNCACGKALNIPDRLSGKKVKCPCGNIVEAIEPPIEIGLEAIENTDENVKSGKFSILSGIGYLLIAFALIDFATGNLGICDITGVPWSPVLAGVAGSFMVSKGK